MEKSETDTYFSSRFFPSYPAEYSCAHEVLSPRGRIGLLFLLREQISKKYLGDVLETSLECKAVYNETQVNNHKP